MVNCPRDQVWFSWLLFVWWVSLAGCTSSDPQSAKKPEGEDRWSKQVTVVSFPLYEALQVASGERLQLFYPEVPGGQAMDRETVKRVQASRLILLDGTHHVGWVDTVSLPESRKRTTTFDILDRLIMVDNLGSHLHGPGGEHSHKGVVAQTWLDLGLFRLQLRTALVSCAKAGLVQESEIDGMVERWWKEVQALDEKLSQWQQVSARKVIADRAGTEYLLGRLGWPVEIQELDKIAARDAGQLERELRLRLVEEPALVIVLTRPPTEELDSVLKRLPIAVLSLDLIDRSTGGGYMDRLRQNLKNIENVIGQDP
jgi:zinc transport system substrate-binding protein